MEIRSLSGVNFDTIFESFERAFADYEVHFEKDEVRSMLTRRGYNPDLSFAAFDDGKIVSFTLNGIGTFNGLATAYDTGTGTVKAYRGRGLAVEIFKYSLPYLKQAGIGQYLLEVLQNNEKAISVYRRMHFDTVREFNCFRQSISEITNTVTITKSQDICIKAIDASLVEQAESFCDFQPSWQNSIASILRGISDLTCIGAFRGDRLPGFAVFDATTGDLTQIAVDKQYRRQGIASLLLAEVVKKMKTDFIKVLNIPVDNTSLSQFLESKNIVPLNKQYEMILPLDSNCKFQE